MDLIAASAVVGGLVFLLFWYLKEVHYTYWKRKGVPQLRPELFYGDMKAVFTQHEHISITAQKAYNQFKKQGHVYGGIYMFFARLLIAVDIDFVKRIYQKDFPNFQSIGLFSHEKDILNQNLLSLHGERWKLMRSSLTPTFSSSKIKNMYDTMIEKAANLKKHSEEIASSGKPFDAKDLMARYATDVIVSAAFGVECDSLAEPNNLFRRYVHDLFNLSLFHIVSETFIPWWILGHLGHKLFGSDALAKFFVGMVKETAEARKSVNSTKKDFFYFLMQIKNKDFDKKQITNKERVSNDGLTYEQMAAQSFLFYVGGFETTATTTSFALLNLALHPEYQERCRQEVKEVLEKHDQKMSYEAAMEMTYLDQFLLESMRIYPPFGNLQRECTKDYTDPVTKQVIKKGTRILVPVRGIHMDPEYYPNPKVFNPENFSKENKQNRPDCTFLAFGEGPRQCIGLRFGLLNAKVGIATLLRDFYVNLNTKMQLPVVIDVQGGVTTAKGNIWLDLVKA